MKKKSVVLLCTVLLLTGCGVGTEKEYFKVGATKSTVEEKAEDTSPELEEQVKKDVEEFQRDKDQASGTTVEEDQNASTSTAAAEDTGLEVTMTNVDWSYDTMDANVQAFFVDLGAWKVRFENTDKVLLTDYELDEPTDEVDVIWALEEFMFVKYSKEWDLGYDTDLNPRITFEDDDDLAKKFGFPSSAYASELWERLEPTMKARVKVNDAVRVDTYDYAGDFIPMLDKFEYYDGTTPNTLKATDATGNDDAVFAYNDAMQTYLTIPLVGTAMTELDGERYWLMVPNTYACYNDDLHFDGQAEVDIYADWAKLIREMDGPYAEAKDLPSYKFKEDHGIAIANEKWLADMSESDFGILVEQLNGYIDTDYNVEVLDLPSWDAVHFVLPPYQTYQSYFGITGQGGGANIERLVGDYRYWENREIGGAYIEP